MSANACWLRDIYVGVDYGEKKNRPAGCSTQQEVLHRSPRGVDLFKDFGSLWEPKPGLESPVFVQGMRRISNSGSPVPVARSFRPGGVQAIPMPPDIRRLNQGFRRIAAKAFSFL
jgi:hypothetical protein